MILMRARSCLFLFYHDILRDLIKISFEAILYKNIRIFSEDFFYRRVQLSYWKSQKIR